MRKLIGTVVFVSVLFVCSLAKGEEFFPEERNQAIVRIYEQMASEMANLQCPRVLGDSYVIILALGKTLDGKLLNDNWLSEMQRLVAAKSEGRAYLISTEDPTFPDTAPHGHLIVFSEKQSRRYVISPKSGGVFCEAVEGVVNFSKYSLFK